MSSKNNKIKKLTLPQNEFHKTLSFIQESNIESNSLQKLKSIQMLLDLSHEKKSQNKKSVTSLVIFIVILVLGYISGFHTREGFTRVWFWWSRIYDKENTFCTISMPSALQNALMPRFDCKTCSQLENIPKVANLTPNEFSKRYAYSGVPVVVTDAMYNWTATNVFSFQFFKQIYSKDSPALDGYEIDCQFFPYKTEFRSLREVLNMSPQRARLDYGSDPWYVGWSNCDPSVANLLRQHYQRPYFLPLDSEGTKMDWIFMGSPKYGAHMHVDHVGNPSWQAQVKGYKSWTLEPPPECYTTCKQLKVVVEPGEIIVLDTNQWYHQTNIVGEEISITIGSEYD